MSRYYVSRTSRSETLRLPPGAAFATPPVSGGPFHDATRAVSSAPVLSHTAARSVFVLSGAAALLYQIVWQRLLVLFSGSDIYSSTLVIASFMTGLGIGHLAGGHLADRRSPRNCLLLFAIAEAAIALFGLFSSFL